MVDQVILVADRAFDLHLSLAGSTAAVHQAHAGFLAILHHCFRDRRSGTGSPSLIPSCRIQPGIPGTRGALGDDIIDLGCSFPLCGGADFHHHPVLAIR